MGPAGVCVCVSVWVCAYLYVDISEHAYKCMYVYVRTYIIYIYTYNYTHTYTRIHRYIGRGGEREIKRHAHVSCILQNREFGIVPGMKFKCGNVSNTRRD